MRKFVPAILFLLFLYIAGCAATGGPVLPNSMAPSPAVAVEQAAVAPEAAEKAFQHVVILGDPHLPGKDIKAKEAVIRRINSWEDVDLVVAVGDICSRRGTPEEYAAAASFFGKLDKPFCPIAGNHDCVYKDEPGPTGKQVRAKKAMVEKKRKRFREAFNLPDINYHRTAGPCLLVFLSTDDPEQLARISERQMKWLNGILEQNRAMPTVVFFHAPLKGTLRNYSKSANTPGFVAQPAAKIHDILEKNPQVFLWVSGHTHTTPRERSFASDVNLYAGRVTNIHNSAMTTTPIWTNSLFIYPDRVIVKTYDHGKKAWLPRLERVIPLPAIGNREPAAYQGQQSHKSTD